MGVYSARYSSFQTGTIRELPKIGDPKIVP